LRAMTDIVIRAATPADLPAITAIYAEAVRLGTATFELDPPDKVEMSRRMERLVAGGFPYLVATRDGELAGYAYAGPYHSRPAFRFTVEDSIYLAPGVQNQGIGRQLLAELIKVSEQRGFRQMVAVIGDSAHAASIALHRSAGFRMVGTLADVGYKFGRWLDSVMMQRALGEGASSAPDA
jgi:L-amino acid N-acyltransferase YncA